MNPAHNASLGNASYSRGDKLRLCAPAHSGLPLNAVAIVAASRPSPEGFRYDLTLTGGGASGSDVQFVKEVPEEWLRSESRIATAKACAQRPWGLWLRSSPRLLVPLFQVSTAIVGTPLCVRHIVSPCSSSGGTAGARRSSSGCGATWLLRPASRRTG